VTTPRAIQKIKSSIVDSIGYSRPAGQTRRKARIRAAVKPGVTRGKLLHFVQIEWQGDLDAQRRDTPEPG
jgi:hypothetical protein